MNNIKRMIPLLLLGLGTLFSQPSKTMSIFIASEGTEAMPTEKASDKIGDFAEYLSASLHFKFDESSIFDVSDFKLRTRSLKIYDDYDSTSFLYGGIFTAWEDNPNNPGMKTAVGTNPNPVTFDYILNTLQFIPAKRFLFFTCSPAYAQFDTVVLANYVNEFSVGRLLINITGPADDDYGDWISSFTGIIDDMEELEPTSDGNLDRNISLSEWFIVLQLKAREEGLILHPYLISKGKDFNLYQLEE